MSQENVEVLRSGYAAPDPLTTFAERIAPDVEFDLTAVYPDRPVFRGTDAVRRFIDEGPWAGTIRFEPERFFDVDDERVLVFVRVSAIGQGSGAAAEARAAHEFTIRDGLLVRFKAYLDRAEALQALGLREEAMSQENTELVRRGYEAFAQGDIEAALAMFHPDIQVEDHDRSLATPTTYHGREGFLTLFATVNEGFSDVRYTPEQLTEVGDRVLAEVRRTGRGRASGAQVDERQFHVWKVVAGRAARFQVYLDRDQALQAAGLSE